jgi:hypothetical protein
LELNLEKKTLCLGGGVCYLLLEVLDTASFSNDVDSWRWLLSPDGCFSVISAYYSLSKELVVGSNLQVFEAKIFGDIWHSPVPSKVIAFSWQLLHDRVPTKDNIFLRGILPQGNDGLCVWCGSVREFASHLFLHCKMAFPSRVIFRSVRREPLELVEEVKVLSWKWSADRLKISPCLYYEWVWDPDICFNR